MKRIAAAIIAGAIGATGVLGAPAAYAQGTPAASATTALNAEMQRLFMTLATVVLAGFAANASKGSLEGFDPGPALEATLRNALASRDLQGAIDRVVDQAVRGVDGPDGAAASPEMRAMLKAALSGAVALSRSEIARELSGMPAPAAAYSP